MAELAERLPPTPEGSGSNPTIRKILIESGQVSLIEKTKIKDKRPGIVRFIEPFLMNS